MPAYRYCALCYRELNIPGVIESWACDGNCLRCAADAGDPDALRALEGIANIDGTHDFQMADDGPLIPSVPMQLPTPPRDDEWWHVTTHRENNVTRQYINGEEQFRAPNDPDLELAKVMSAPIYGYTAGWRELWRHFVDCLRRRAPQPVKPLFTVDTWIRMPKKVEP